MAVFKICNTKTSGHTALKAVAKYIVDERKTQSELISGIGDFILSDLELTPNTIYSEFLRIKELFDKDTGRQYMHAIQSFAPGEIDADVAHKLGKKLGSELWEGFQVVVVTHTDKNHIHNHFLVNSVSYDSGTKLHWTKQDLARAKAINDSICLQNKLSIPHKKSHMYDDGSIKSPVFGSI